MSGSRWVITPLWLSGLWRSFLYSSSVYSCHLFLISSPSVRSVPSDLYWTHLCMKCTVSISNFLVEISHSVVFLYFLHWLLRKAFLSLLAILWNSAFKWEYLSLSPLLYASLHFTATELESSSQQVAVYTFGKHWSKPLVRGFVLPCFVHSNEVFGPSSVFCCPFTFHQAEISRIGLCLALLGWSTNAVCLLISGTPDWGSV